MSGAEKSAGKSQSVKSRFRGVYKCGPKKWKSQLQAAGVQYYLGTYATEKEAALAYDNKIRSMGGKSQTNFDEDGNETHVCQVRLGSYPLVQRRDMMVDSQMRFAGQGVKDDGTTTGRRPELVGTNGDIVNKRSKTEGNASGSSSHDYMASNSLSHDIHARQAPADSSSSSTGALGHLPSLPAFATAEHLPDLWDTLCKISERLNLAKCAEPKLIQIVLKLSKSDCAEDAQKESSREVSLLKSLQMEIFLLTEKKAAVERLIAGFTDSPTPTTPAFLLNDGIVSDNGAAASFASSSSSSSAAAFDPFVSSSATAASSSASNAPPPAPQVPIKGEPSIEANMVPPSVSASSQASASEVPIAIPNRDQSDQTAGEPLPSRDQTARSTAQQPMYKK